MRPKHIGNYNHYTDELKRRVIAEYVNTDKNFYQLGREYGVNPKTVFYWLKRAKAVKPNPIKPFNALLSLIKNGKVVDQKECASVDAARALGIIWQKKGFEFEIMAIK